MAVESGILRTMIRALRLVLVGCLFAQLFWSAGCVRRTITITSEPEGALVWLNDREIGRTPVTVDFLYYGRYDVRLEADGYQPMMTSGKARAPVWDMVGVDLAAALMPFEMRSEVAWHYDMQPVDADQAELVERARSMRRELGVGDEPADGESTAEAASAGSTDQ